MSSRLSLIALLLLACSSLVPVSAQEPWQLTRAQWSGPRDGERLLTMPVLRQVMATLAQHPDARLLIRYPGGEDGIIWVAELRAWLVALGLPSARIETRPGSPSPDVIELEILNIETTS